MSRLHPEKKTCENCNNTFFAKRSDAHCCSSSCRARLSELGKKNETVIEFVEPFNMVKEAPDINKGVNSELINELEQFEDTQPLLEMEYCNNCYYAFEKEDLYHHKSRAWFSDLYFCQKCINCCNIGNEYVAISFEQQIVCKWNADNKHNHEVLQILLK